MSKILLIETATSVCSVALAEEGRVVARRESDVPNAHSTQLPLFVKELIDGVKLEPSVSAPDPAATRACASA